MIVPSSIYDRNLSHRAIAVYCYLCDRANGNGECYPSTRRIASDLRISRRTVFRALNELENAGLITRQKRRRAAGGCSSNLYRIGGESHV